MTPFRLILTGCVPKPSARPASGASKETNVGACAAASADSHTGIVSRKSMHNREGRDGFGFLRKVMTYTSLGRVMHRSVRHAECVVKMKKFAIGVMNWGGLEATTAAGRLVLGTLRSGNWCISPICMGGLKPQAIRGLRFSGWLGVGFGGEQVAAEGSDGERG